jgi:hypothetical protein
MALDIVLLHGFNRLFRAEKNTREVGVDYTVPVVGAGVADFGFEPSPGVVDQDINSAELFTGPGEQIDNVILACNVGLNIDAVGIKGQDVLLQGLEFFDTTGGKDDTTAFFRELYRRSPPYPATGAGYHNDFVSQTDHLRSSI